MATADHDALASDPGEVRWDLEPIVDSGGDAGVDRLLDEATVAATSFAAAYAGEVASLDAAGFERAIDELAAIRDLLIRASTYAELRFSADTDDPAAGALNTRALSRRADVDARVLFFELEWTALDDAAADALLRDARRNVAHAAHHLRRLRGQRPHQLSEPEERLLAQTRSPRLSAWQQLYTERTGALRAVIDGEPVSIMSAWTRTESSELSVRRVAMDAIGSGLEEGLELRATIYNAVLDEKAIDDGLRGHETWIASRNLDNELPDEAVVRLIDAVSARVDLAHRWFALKRRLLGLDAMTTADVRATLAGAPGLAGGAAGPTAEPSWSDTVRLVLDAYGAFHPRAGEIAASFLSGRRVDAPVAPAKQGGAFCTDGTSTSDPYVLLNFAGAPSDLMAMAHEFGHGLHFTLTRPLGPFGQPASIPYVEFPSNFGEALVLDHQQRTSSDDGARLTALGTWIDSAFSNLFFATSAFRFEATIHNRRRSTGPLTADEYAAAWRAELEQMYGDVVTIDRGEELWWSYLPHMVGMPGYLYAYPFGILVALSAAARYRDVGAPFADDYLAMLAAGGTRSPTDLLAMIGIDLLDPRIWETGLEMLAAWLGEAERLAAALS